MDNLLEYIIPLVFAAIYFFGNMLSKKEESDESTPTRRQVRPEEDPEAVERQRRIQEEIRRKIMERRAASEGAPVQRERAEEVPRETPQPVFQSPEPEVSPTKTPVEQTSVEQSEAGDFAWGESDNAYETVMQRRMQEIEAINRQAEKLKRDAEQASQRTDTKSAIPQVARRSGLLTGSIKQTLKNPAAARAAFIYGEVLGQPVSQQKVSSVPGLKN